MKRAGFCAGVWARLVSFFGRTAKIRRGDGVLAAVSGGPDSVCLLHFLSRMSARYGFRLAVCHVNHGIRGKKADADAKFVGQLCLAEKIPYVCAVVDAKAAAKKQGLSLEHAARNLRYRALYKAAKKFRCSKIAFGHHLDDHAETILLNLLRGTNPKGLLGIPARRPLGAGFEGVELIRPLLCVTRGEIMEYVRHNNLSYRTDETNESEEYTRNWVRKTLLPLIEKKQPQFRAHLLEFSSKLSALIGD
ncbi:MAG: tRNA lysidine(34) synthetase TilS [Elusimicrobiales bacterium]|nr:tRNA lysidine(34) synthetase TilS [Elusimicrobiales bacterium]